MLAVVGDPVKIKWSDVAEKVRQIHEKFSRFQYSLCTRSLIVFAIFGFVLRFQVQLRTGKACRDRWRAVLDPSVNREPWSAEEDETLKQIHAVRH